MDPDVMSLIFLNRRHFLWWHDGAKYIMPAMRIPRNCQPEKIPSIGHSTKKYSPISLTLFTFDMRVLGNTILFTCLIIEFRRQIIFLCLPIHCADHASHCFMPGSSPGCLHLEKGSMAGHKEGDARNRPVRKAGLPSLLVSNSGNY